MASDAKKEYEVLHRVRLEDGTLVRPANEDNPLTEDVTTLSLTDEEAQPFLATSAVRLVPNRRRVAAGDEEPTETAPVTPAPPAPPVEPSAPTLAETFGEDTAQILQDAGYATVAEVEGATDEVLLGIDGIGPKRLEKIRAA